MVTFHYFINAILFDLCIGRFSRKRNAGRTNTGRKNPIERVKAVAGFRALSAAASVSILNTASSHRFFNLRKRSRGCQHFKSQEASPTTINHYQLFLHRSWGLLSQMFWADFNFRRLAPRRRNVKQNRQPLSDVSYKRCRRSYRDGNCSIFYEIGSALFTTSSSTRSSTFGCIALSCPMFFSK